MKEAGVKVKRIPQPNNETEICLQTSQDNLDAADEVLRTAAKDLTEEYEAQTETIEETDDGRDSGPDPTDGAGGFLSDPDAAGEPVPA
jgi:hypothetical protein